MDNSDGEMENQTCPPLLPYVPFQNVAQYLSPVDLLAISLFGENHEFMRKMKFDGLSFTVEVGDNVFCLALSNGTEKAEWFIVESASSEYVTDEHKQAQKPLTLKGHVFYRSRNYYWYTMQYEKETLKYVFMSRNPRYDVKFFVDHIKNIFRLPLDEVILSEDYFYQASYLSRTLHDCNKLTICGERFDGGCSKMNCDFLNELVQNSKAKKWRIHNSFGIKFRPEETIGGVFFEADGRSIKADDFDRLKIKTISIRNSFFHDKDYHKIIKLWSLGAYETVEHVIFWRGFWDDELLNDDQLKHGFDVVSTDGRNVQTIIENMASSFEIHRADGQVAVISTNGFQGGNEFRFRMIVFKTLDSTPICKTSFSTIEHCNWPKCNY